MALPLKFKSIKNRENYLVSKCNQEAVKLIENFKFWQNRKTINSIPAAFIYGPKGSGKTHLCSIFKEKVNCTYLTSLTSDNREIVAEGKNFILDDFMPGKNFPSELVMHFINHVTYKEGSILLLSRFSFENTNAGMKIINEKIFRFNLIIKVNLYMTLGIRCNLGSLKKVTNFYRKQVLLIKLFMKVYSTF